MNNVAKTKICQNCNEIFAPASNSVKWCDVCLTLVCDWCNKKFISRRRTRRNVRFCSLDCTNAWQNDPKSKEISRQRTIKLRGSGEIRQCPTCGESFYVPGWRVRQGFGKYCNTNCRDYSADLQGINRILRFPHNPGNNRLEAAGAIILDDLSIDYLEQQVIGGKFVVDILIPSHAIVIQWDGDFWHANPLFYANKLYDIQKVNIKRDKSCTAYLEKCGYCVLRFWETDVHSRPSWVATEILAALANSDNT